MILSSVSVLISCKSESNTPRQTTNVTEEIKETGIDMTEYKVIYPDDANSFLKKAVSAFCEKLGNIPKTIRSEDPSKEIKLTLIKGDGKKHSWTVDIGNGDIEISGTDNEALIVGMKQFLKRCDRTKFLGEAGNYFDGEFGNEVRVFENLSVWTLTGETVIDKPEGTVSSVTMKYPTIIELCHQPNEANNGILLASGERWLGDYNCPIYKSVDKGESFETLTFVKDTLHRGTRSAFAPCLFELPRAVGDMPAGTIILGSNCINSGWDAGYIVLFRSFDCGETWEAFKTIAGGTKSNGTFGVWEPNFVVTDDGVLICYYSDETDPKHSQKLVYRCTSDGKNWDPPVDMVSLSNGGLRPGMPVVTRMNDGTYVLAYEIVGLAGNPVYCRYSDDPLNFGKVTENGKQPKVNGATLAATPWISFLNVGGSEGMLMLTGWRMASGTSKTGSDIFISMDRGESWTSIPNFYSYKWGSDDDTWGYSVSFLLSSDGETLYYMANPKIGNLKNTYVLYKITIE